MLQDSLIKVTGFTWVCSNPQEACQACASLHGQEFYYHPQPGQKDAAEAPEPPLHPHCRCTKEDLFEYQLATEVAQLSSSSPDSENQDQSQHPSIKPYMKDVIRHPNWGVLLRKPSEDHLILSRIPIWGKHCGPGWADGRNLYDPGSKPVTDPTPEDSMDAICRAHDICYDNFPEIYCDALIIKNLQELNPDPMKWSKPPKTVAEARDAAIYRNVAILAFTVALARKRVKAEMKRPEEFSPLAP
ncbi:MAG: hypothetical protein AB1814_10145 [Thermodesulfobacteriota bacterium]